MLAKAGVGPAAPEPAIRAVPAAEPRNAPDRHNLEVLLRASGRWVEGYIDSLLTSPPA